MGVIVLSAYAVSVAAWWAVHALDVQFQVQEGAKHRNLAAALAPQAGRSVFEAEMLAVEEQWWNQRIRLAERARVNRRWAPVWPLLALGVLVEAVRERARRRP